MHCAGEYRVSESGAGTLTGKIFECLGVGRPILLLAPPGPASDLVEESGAGVGVNPSDVARAASTILQMASTSREFAGSAPNVLAPYERDRQAREWSHLLRSPLDSRAQSQ